MRWISVLVLGLLVLSCELPVADEKYDNPLDEEASDETGIASPALLFFPDSSVINIGSSITIDIFAKGVDSLAGAFISLQYNPQLLSVLSINNGSFFADSSETVFLVDHNSDTGDLTINTIYLGDTYPAVSGTGSLASIVFTSLAGGKSVLQFNSESEFVDPEDVAIEIAGFGRGVIDAQ